MKLVSNLKLFQIWNSTTWIGQLFEKKISFSFESRQNQVDSETVTVINKNVSESKLNINYDVNQPVNCETAIEKHVIDWIT